MDEANKSNASIPTTLTPGGTTYIPANVRKVTTTTTTTTNGANYYIEPKEPLIRRAVGGFVKWLFDSIQVVVIALAIFIICYLLVISPHTIDGGSMTPNFCNADFVIADKLSPRFKPYTYGDVIVFKWDESNDYIKRVLGLGGDVMKIQNGKVYRNSQLVSEPYLNPSVSTTILDPNGDLLKEGIDYVVPEGKIFVLGDNRIGSKDSRHFGAITPSQNTIKGRALFVVSPLSRMRIFDKNAAYPLDECKK